MKRCIFKAAQRNLIKGLHITYLPKLGTNLVTALASLNVDDLSHYELKDVDESCKVETCALQKGFPPTAEGVPPSKCGTFHFNNLLQKKLKSSLTSLNVTAVTNT